MTGRDLGGTGDGGIRASLPPPLAPTPSSPASFDHFYAEHYPGMVRLARVLVDSPQTAEDLVQDAFVRMHRHWGSVREPSPYLRRCVVNACRSHHRRLGRERRGTEPATEWRGAGQVIDGAPATPGAAAPSEARADDADQLVGALGALPYRQRAAVVLRFYADLPDAEIATALGCRVGTVASLVHRALERLREVVPR